MYFAALDNEQRVRKKVCILLPRGKAPVNRKPNAIIISPRLF
jgi:hypothetical protein